MLKRFRTPGWQHPNADVRRQAVQDMSWSEDSEALVHVAREDEVPSLRRLALRHAIDLELLLERASEDDDSTVRAQAERRFRELLAGQHDGGPQLADRIKRVDDIDDQSLLEFLAREGCEEALRKHSMQRVDRENVLRDIALSDPSPALRLEALSRINDEAILKRVYERSRKNDKHVSRQARERLDALQAERERPAQVAAQCQQICTSVEYLGRDQNWQRDEALLEQLDLRWHAIEEDLRSEFDARFSAAKAQFRQKLSASRARDGQLRAAKEALIARMEALRDAGRDDQRVDTKWIETQTAALADTSAEWAQLEALPPAAEQPLCERFESLQGAVRSAIEAADQQAVLTQLLSRHDRLLKGKGAVSEAAIKSLEREMAALPAETGKTGSLRKRLNNAHSRLRERRREQSAWKERTLESLPERLTSLKESLGGESSRDAIAEHDAIAADLDALARAGVSNDRVKPLRARLRPLTHEVKVLRAWDRFGNQQAQTQLCEQMEDLKGAELHPNEIARQVRDARALWKELAKKSQGRADQALWQRFDSAATEAYLPCKQHFEQRAAERKANAEQRRSLIAELERFAGSASGGPDMDWKGAVRFRRDLLKRWHQAHPVDAKAVKPLNAELDKQLAVLDALLGRERERSREQRERLIQEAAALANESDKKSAAESCKRLQRQWQVTVPGSRAEEQALWDRFRAACDAIFAERQQAFDDARASDQENVELRSALCARVEALTDVSADSLEDAERELRRTQSEWRNAAPAPKRDANALQKRFNAAVHAFQARRRALQRERESMTLTLMRDKAAVCHTAEHAEPSRRAELNERWQSLASLPDENDEAQMAARFEHALSALDTPDDTARDEGSLAANLETRESLCLRMEIAAGIESPPEYAQARMAEQVARLAAALEDRGAHSDMSSQEIVRAWCTCGPAPRTHASKLEARFERAWAALQDPASADDG